MSEVIANRYAEALFQLAEEKELTENILESSRIVAEVFREHPELRFFLNRPDITDEQKEQFLDKILSSIERDLLNTVKLLVQRDRIDIIPRVMHAFVKLVNSARGVAEATVYTARKVSTETLCELETVFAKRFGKKEMHLENIVDSSVIGGVKIRVGNTIYDGSLSGKLNRMKREIASVNK